MVSAFIGWKRVESLMVPWKSKRIKSRHDYRHNLVPVDCFWSFFYVWFYQKINFRTGFWMKICFWKSSTRRPGTVSGALFFQPGKLKNDRFYKVFGVLRFHSFCIYFHKFSSLSFSPEYALPAACLEWCIYPERALRYNSQLALRNLQRVLQTLSSLENAIKINGFSMILKSLWKPSRLSQGRPQGSH